MKNEAQYEVLGLMSGTSLDGFDLAHCRFTFGDGPVQWQILAAETVNYSDDMKERLRLSTNISAQDISLLHVELGTWYGQQAKNFLDSRSLHPDYIASHGHTVFHQPEKRLTVQIGSGYEIYRATQIPVICDFRAMDVALGGQGAPLVPIGDRLLFPQFDACLNLGGIANISYENNGYRIAYDVVVCNMVQNYLTKRIDLEYDENGKIAASGKVLPGLLKQLNALEFYQSSYPKSLGFEYVRENIFPLLETGELPDLLRTCLEHSALLISDAVAAIPSKGSIDLLVTGGGTFNNCLMTLLENHLPKGTGIKSISNEVIAFKEALVFALLGILKVRDEKNILSSVTGAYTDSCSGVMIGAYRL